METFKRFEQNLYPLNDASFDEIALELFQFQAKNNPVYHSYLTALGVEPARIHQLNEIPCLPISLFKSQKVMTGDWNPEAVFTSSATTGQEVSRHLVQSIPFYLNHSQKVFETQFGPLDQWHVLCLLPSYLERTGSSLVKMADHFIKESKSVYSGFYLNNLDNLAEQLEALRGKGKVLLLGVTFALLDLAEQFDLDLSHCTIMETGGMKGRRPEITRAELHRILCDNFNVQGICSEYGMTEMLSQAYSKKDGVFSCPASLKVVIKEVNDPFGCDFRTAGLMNVIDLANIYSCAFIETQDLGRWANEGHFEVVGRMDNSEVRGCNLLVN